MGIQGREHQHAHIRILRYWGAVSVRMAVRLVGAALTKGGIE